MKPGNEAVLRKILEMVTCSSCGRRYRMSDVRVIGQRDHVWAMRVRCRECNTQALLLAMVGEAGTSPVATDLSPEEWERFRDAPEISWDDVILAHEHLARYYGDFGDILEEPLPKE